MFLLSMAKSSQFDMAVRYFTATDTYTVLTVLSLTIEVKLCPAMLLII